VIIIGEKSLPIPFIEESPRKWRQAHPDYWRQYRQNHPLQVERNRQQQRLRDQKRQLANLANNNLASCNTLTLQSLSHLEPKLCPSCKQHPSGLVSLADL
jgi:hypothetical protein